MGTNREIKFRAWDIIHNKMCYFTDCFAMCPNGGYWQYADQGYLVNNSEEKEFHLMQFTGLKDKNGVEIYEGDIMKDTFGAICQIVYVSEYGGYRQLSKIGYSPLNQLEIIGSKDIVIGNVFENSELLK